MLRDACHQINNNKAFESETFSCLSPETLMEKYGFKRLELCDERDTR